MIDLSYAFFLLLKGYGDIKLSGQTSSKQSCSEDVEQEIKASSDFITAKQKYVSSNVMKLIKIILLVFEILHAKINSILKEITKYLLQLRVVCSPFTDGGVQSSIMQGKRTIYIQLIFLLPLNVLYNICPNPLDPPWKHDAMSRWKFCCCNSHVNTIKTHR